MDKIGLRIKELRKLKKITQKQLAALLEVDESTAQYYEYGKIIPRLDKLIKLSDFFDVSLDYLVGRSDDPVRH